MNCVDDLGVVDPLEVDRGDAEVAVAELALDDHERHTFASHFDGVGVPQLIWGEPSADTCCDGRAPQLGSGGSRPLGATRPAVEDADRRPTGSTTRSSSHGWSSSQPHVSMPTSRRRPPLPRRTSSAPRRSSRSASTSASASWMRSPARQRTTIKPRKRRPCASSPAARMTAMISSTLGGSARSGHLCFAAVAQHGSRAWSPAIGVDQRGQAASRSWSLLGLGEQTEHPSPATAP
jgi:hypothetical protein